MIWFSRYDGKATALVDVLQDGETLKYQAFQKHNSAAGPKRVYKFDTTKLPETGRRTFGRRIEDEKLKTAIANAKRASEYRRQRYCLIHDHFISCGLELIYRGLDENVPRTEIHLMEEENLHSHIA